MTLSGGDSAHRCAGESEMLSVKECRKLLGERGEVVGR